MKIYKYKLGAERDLDALQKDDSYVPDSEYFKAYPITGYGAKVRHKYDRMN